MLRYLSDCDRKASPRTDDHTLPINDLEDRREDELVRIDVEGGTAFYSRVFDVKREAVSTVTDELLQKPGPE